MKLKQTEVRADRLHAGDWFMMAGQRYMITDVTLSPHNDKYVFIKYCTPAKPNRPALPMTLHRKTFFKIWAKHPKK